MTNFENREAAFASQNFDPAAVVIEGVPAHHVEALKHAAQLMVLHDAVNPDFQPDHTNWEQRKYFNYGYNFSPSGSRFSFDDHDNWSTHSSVGARLESESPEAAKHVRELGEESYKGLMAYERPSAKK